MEIVARPQLANDDACAIIRKALGDASLLEKLWPTLTDDGQRVLEDAGIPLEKRNELLQILNLAVIGAQQGNLAAPQPRSADRPGYEGIAYGIIRKALDDPILLPKLYPNLTDDGQRALAEAGIGQPEQCDELLQILSLAVTGAQQRNAVTRQMQEAALQQQLEMIKGSGKVFDQTMAVIKSMKDGLTETVRQIDSAFRQTMWMYAVSFYLGVALIVAAIVSAWGGRQLLPMVLGGLGTANTLTFFFTKPPERLQSSRASLAQLQIALLAWFNDFYNQNALMSQLNSLGKLDTNQFGTMSKTIIHNTEKMMILLHDYCKLVENPRDKKTPATVVAAPKAEPTAAQSDAA
jgi:hypothetical protein